ncbi:MAG: diaminopimelate epimerase, partial [Clostridiales bacterium]|nr:diaminopimelate epimerase [Clostridiales bacterium]
HVVRAGIHSGDSIAVYPPCNIDDGMWEIIVDNTIKLGLALYTIGLINIQYLICGGKLYVIEVNPRSSRTVPYISKVTGVPMVDLATRCMTGDKLSDMGFGTGLFKKSPYVAVKVPVFSFEKLLNVDTMLGPEMKSTGEVLGIATTRGEALYKGLRAAGYRLNKKGGIFVTVRDRDKAEIIHVVKKFADLGFTIYATEGTAVAFKNVGINAVTVPKIYESENNGLSLIESGKVDYVISTSTRGRIPTRDSVKIRRKAVERSIPCLTSIDTANAVVDCLMSKYSQSTIELVDINNMRREKRLLPFSKMQTCGNDYIYFNCLKKMIESPESLSIRLSDRHLGIGGDGVVLICPSEIADASVQIYNMDGTNGGIGGNALRCVCKYLYDNGIVTGKNMTIEVGGRIRHMRVYTTGGKVSTVTADMGVAEFKPALIPVNLSGDRVINRPASVAGATYNITCLSLGNPHCVVFQSNIHKLDLSLLGPLFEHDSIFPERVNTDFVQVMNETTISMRVWERGNGETQASGTGACAAAVAAVANGYCKKDTDITVKLLGGDLKIRYTDDGVFMTGGATKCFDGTVEI